jgi:hypothetical protein
LNLVEKVALK